MTGDSTAKSWKSIFQPRYYIGAGVLLCVGVLLGVASTIMVGTAPAEVRTAFRFVGKYWLPILTYLAGLAMYLPALAAIKAYQKLKEDIGNAHKIYRQKSKEESERRQQARQDMWDERQKKKNENWGGRKK